MATKNSKTIKEIVPVVDTTVEEDPTRRMYFEMYVTNPPTVKAALAIADKFGLDLVANWSVMLKTCLIFQRSALCAHTPDHDIEQAIASSNLNL